MCHETGSTHSTHTHTHSNTLGPLGVIFTPPKAWKVEASRNLARKSWKCDSHGGQSECGTVQLQRRINGPHPVSSAPSTLNHNWVLKQKQHTPSPSPSTCTAAAATRFICVHVLFCCSGTRAAALLLRQLSACGAAARSGTGVQYGWLQAPGNALHHPQFQKHWTVKKTSRKRKRCTIICHSLLMSSLPP